MTSNRLGSPRVITDQNGNVTSRKDFAAFGDETITAQRTSRSDYTTQNPTRKDYTGYEKDNESGLEFAQARFYNSTHGRFTSIDPLTASASIKNPQTFNRYSYVLNSPYKFTDPLGLLPTSMNTRYGGCGAEFSGCDENGNGYGVDEEANRQYQTQVARLQAQQAFARGDTEEGWQIIRESEGSLQALDQNGNAVQDPNEPTVTVEATVNGPPDDDEPGNDDVGITIVAWDKVLGLSTRVLGHMSFIIDDMSYSFDTSDYHVQTIGDYLNKSLKISGATFYVLDFGSKTLNDQFKDLIKGEYKGALSYYTGVNNCSSAFGRSVNAMHKDLGTWTIRNTPGGVKAFITGSLSKYLTGQYRLEER